MSFTKIFRSRAQVLESVNYIFRRIMGEDLGGITYDDNNALYPGADFPEGGEFLKTEVLLVEKTVKSFRMKIPGRRPRSWKPLPLPRRSTELQAGSRFLTKKPEPTGHWSMAIS